MKGAANRIALLAVAVALASLQCSADHDSDTVLGRTWTIDPIRSGAPPELADERLAVPWLKDRPSFGIAFSGGGTRSAAASLGELRALHDLGWLARARHISANSGGSWAAVPYTYLPTAIPEEGRRSATGTTPVALR